MPYTVLESIIENAALTPNKLAIIDSERTLTYQQLLTYINNAAGFLKSNGVLSGSTIMISAYANSDFVVCYFAAQLIGATCVPYSSSDRPNWIENIYNEVNATFILSDKIYPFAQNKTFLQSELMSSSFPEIQYCPPDADSISDILYTSGTTGKGKGVVLTHKSTYFSACNILKTLAITDNDTIILPLPLNHSNALGTVRAYLLRGATIILSNGIMSLNYLKQMLRTYNCTAFSCSPVMLEMLDVLTNGALPELLQSVRYIEIGTAPTNIHLREKLKTYFPNTRLFINFGATEAPRAVYMDLNDSSSKIQSIGQPIGDYKAVILDDEYNIISTPNRTGHLAICGKALMSGYWKDPYLTSKAIINGFFITGDIAYIDSDNYIFLVGRNNDLIIVGGEKVYPYEIEDVILDFSQIKECACIPIDDPKKILGQRPTAFVVRKPETDLNLTDLKKYLYSKLDSYKIPFTIIEIDSLPRNQIGKVDRKELSRQWYEIYLPKNTFKSTN